MPQIRLDSHTHTHMRAHTHTEWSSNVPTSNFLWAHPENTLKTVAFGPAGKQLDKREGCTDVSLQAFGGVRHTWVNNTRICQVLSRWVCWIFFFFLMKASFFLYFWLCWVFVSVRGLSLVAASGGHSSSQCASLSLSRPLLLQSTGSRRAGSVVVAHGPSCSAACGIFPDQGSNPCPLHWQADSQPLHHQGSPLNFYNKVIWHKLPSVHPIGFNKLFSPSVSASFPTLYIIELQKEWKMVTNKDALLY